MKNSWPPMQEGKIPTKNKTGFMFPELNGASLQFLEDAKHYSAKVMDLGCAYGALTLALLEKTNCEVIAFDLCQEHLDILKASTPLEQQKRLQLVQGHFPRDFNFPANSLTAIHSSFLLHFLTGEETQEGLEKCYKALKPQGKIYLNTMSAYFAPFKGVLAEYEMNAANHLPWPGEIRDIKKYIRADDLPHAPELMHVHKLEDLKAVLTRIGFQVDTMFYYDMKEPAYFASDGKGILGVIASKP